MCGYEKMYGVEIVDVGSGCFVDERDVLLQAFEALKETKLDDRDKRDAESHLDQMAEELEKPHPEPSRLKTLWGYLNVNAPGIAAILQTIELIAKSLPQ